MNASLLKSVKYSYSSDTDFKNLYTLILKYDLIECSKECNNTRFNPLINLMKYYDYFIVCIYFDLFLYGNFDILNQDHEGNTVLHFVKDKSECLVRLLFHKNYKKCILIKNKQGNLPIHTTVYNRDLVNLLIMINKGPDDIFYVKNNNGHNVYDLIKQDKVIDDTIKQNFLELTDTDLKNLSLMNINDDISRIILKYIKMV